MKRWTVTLVGAALAACGPNKIGNNGDSGAPQNDGGGTCGTVFTCPNATYDGGPLAYPACPYATTRGSVFPDYVLSSVTIPGGGFFDPSMSPSLQTPNPDIPAQYAGNPQGAPAFSGNVALHMLHCAAASGYRYALIDISSVWCPHCRDEAQQLPTTWVPQWNQRGGIVFSVLEDGNTVNTPATLSDLNNWVTTYGSNYPVVLDPQETLVSGTNLQAWPANIIIDLRNMTVYDSVFGATFQFFTEFDNLLKQ
jgi:hypothetical protein